MSKTELQVGDVVKIKHHTYYEKGEYPFAWSEIMDQYEGQEFTIKEILHEAKSYRYGDRTTAYVMDDSMNIFTWSRSSLIKIEKKQYQTF